MNKKNQTASLRTMYALDHHGKVFKPIALALQNALDYSGVMHSAGSRLGGANSNYINVIGNRSGGRFRFYLRAVLTNKSIEIRARARGKVLYELKNQRDVLRFVKYLESL